MTSMQTPSLFNRMVWWFFTTIFVGVAVSVFVGVVWSPVLFIELILPIAAILNWGALKKSLVKEKWSLFTKGNIIPALISYAYGFLFLVITDKTVGYQDMIYISFLLLPLSIFSFLGAFITLNLFRDKLLIVNTKR